MGMERYTAFIASTDDFRGTADELVSAWQDEHPAVYHIDFEVPKGTSSRLITLIARGLFWEDQWTSDGTISTVVKDLTPEDTRPLGVDRTEVRKTGSVKDVDLWNPNDPTNW